MPRKSPRRRQDGGVADNIFNDPELRMRFWMNLDDDDTAPAAAPVGSTTGGPAGGSGAGGAPASLLTTLQKSYWKAPIEKVLNSNLDMITNSELTAIINGVGAINPLTTRGLTTGRFDFVGLIVDEVEKRLDAGKRDVPVSHNDEKIAKQIIADFKVHLNGEIGIEMTALKDDKSDKLKAAGGSTDLFNGSGTVVKPIIDPALDASEADLKAMVEKYIGAAYDKFFAARATATATAVDQAYIKTEYDYYTDATTGIKTAVKTELDKHLLDDAVYEAFHKLVEPTVVYDGGRRRKVRRSDGRKPKRSDGRRKNKKRSDGRRGKGRRKSPKYL